MIVVLDTLITRSNKIWDIYALLSGKLRIHPHIVRILAAQVTEFWHAQT